jgi:transcriptional regulator with XRE-family HTH domain
MFDDDPISFGVQNKPLGLGHRAAPPILPLRIEPIERAGPGLSRKTKGPTYPMPTKEELGRRLRTARFERNMTLKQVAQRCGMSATHISEVERGKTSPTIGALQRIASALGERTSHFVQEERLPRVRVTRKSDRSSLYVTDRRGGPYAIQVVSAGIPEGLSQVFTTSAKPGEAYDGYPMIGEVVLLCNRGMVRVSVGDETYVLREGDTLQFRTDDGYRGENICEEESVVTAILATPTCFDV